MPSCVLPGLPGAPRAPFGVRSPRLYVLQTISGCKLRKPPQNFRNSSKTCAGPLEGADQTSPLLPFGGREVRVVVEGRLSSAGPSAQRTTIALDEYCQTLPANGRCPRLRAAPRTGFRPPRPKVTTTRGANHNCSNL